MASDFTSKLSVLTSKELNEARGDPERLAEMFERLLNSAAFTIAMMTKGDKKAMDELLAGAEGYLYDAAAGHIPAARLMSRILP